MLHPGCILGVGPGDTQAWVCPGGLDWPECPWVAFRSSLTSPSLLALSWAWRPRGRRGLMSGFSAEQQPLSRAMGVEGCGNTAVCAWEQARSVWTAA